MNEMDGDAKDGRLRIVDGLEAKDAVRKGEYT